jgi:hypothetical protein
VTDWLIDKSALVRLGTSPDGAEWASRIERGPVRITTVTRHGETGQFDGRSNDQVWDRRGAVLASPPNGSAPPSYRRAPCP